jgi:hypothetical protein
MYHLLYEKEFFFMLQTLYLSPNMTSGHNVCKTFVQSSKLPNHYARFTKYSVSSMILLIKYQQYKVEKNLEIRIIR